MGPVTAIILTVAVLIATVMASKWYVKWFWNEGVMKISQISTRAEVLALIFIFPFALVLWLFVLLPGVFGILFSKMVSAPEFTYTGSYQSNCCCHRHCDCEDRYGPGDAVKDIYRAFTRH